MSISSLSSRHTSIPIQNPINPSETIQVYSISRAKLGLLNELERNSDKIKRWNNGFDADINARVNGGTIFAGASWDRQIRIECEVPDSNQLRFCDQSAFGMPFRTMFKVAGTYPLPYGIEIRAGHSKPTRAGPRTWITTSPGWTSTTT